MLTRKIYILKNDKEKYVYFNAIKDINGFIQLIVGYDYFDFFKK